MKTHFQHIRSSNHRPADHPDFLGDILVEDVVLSAEELQRLLEHDLVFLISQGDKLILERASIE